jgi:hypothetical protein
MQIILDQPKELVIVQEVKKTLQEVNVTQMIDDPTNKTVQAFTLELGVLTLWQGAEYDAIGQWTDTDVINKIKSL